MVGRAVGDGPVHAELARELQTILALAAHPSPAPQPETSSGNEQSRAPTLAQKETAAEKVASRLQFKPPASRSAYTVQFPTGSEKPTTGRLLQHVTACVSATPANRGRSPLTPADPPAPETMYCPGHCSVNQSRMPCQKHDGIGSHSAKRMWR